MSKKMHYKTLETSFEELEQTLNSYAADGFKAVHFFQGPDETVRVVMSRKLKKKHHHDEFVDEPD